MKKKVLDLCMTIVLLILMLYQSTGLEIHEWSSIGMLVLLILHHIFNWKWYQNLFRGKYTTRRSFITITNFLVLVVIITQIISGILMSRYIFQFIKIKVNVVMLRKIHLAGAYWGFVLMSIHIGFHWKIISNQLWKIGKKAKWQRIWQILSKCAGILIAFYGAFTFFNQNILAYMFLSKEFVFFDYTKSAVQIFIEYAVIMGCLIWVIHYALKLQDYILHRKRDLQ